MMRTVLAIIIYLVSAAQVAAQDGYFLCIQTEDQQPFYLRMSNKTWSSSSVGNLVVHGLGDSTYQVSIGWPRNKYPEQNFLVTFNRKDLGYTLKGTDQGWALINWTNGERLLPRSGQTGEAIWYGDRKAENAFTNLMAAVVNDSAVLYVASVKELPGKQQVFANANPAPASSGSQVIKDSAVVAIVDSATAAVQSTQAIVDSAIAVQTVNDSLQAATAAASGAQTKIDSVATKTDSTVTAGTVTLKDTAVASSGLTTIKDTAVAVASGPILVYTAPKPSVTMVKDHILPKGRSLVFTDSLASGVDTISVIIDALPDTINNKVAEQPVIKAAENGPIKSNIAPAPDTAVTITDTAVSTAPAKPAASNTDPAEQAMVKKDSATATESGKKKMVMINSDCSNFASDSDIDKIRVKILDEPTIDSKLAATKKLFKTKCIYTRQIRALSELFMNDEGRYRFFEHCYPFTADTSEFRSLISLLSEDAYIARFKNLVRIKD
jgi:hypothetical protein